VKRSHFREHVTGGQRPGTIGRVSDASSPAAPPAQEPDVLSVADLDRRLRRVVEVATPDVWVEGEVSSFKAASSGHVYFMLKDEREDACIDCVMYRSVALRARSVLRDGARVQVRGRATIWAPRGKLQFSVDAARATGRGSLLEALERLKERLAAEGLFAAERKRPLPSEPRIIGVVTSASGAAIHDIATVAFRRGGARLLLAPAMVQGAEAPSQIIAALERLAKVSGVDVIVVGRGGGASDDLGAFQDEALVRAIAACPVPVVSAVGHEVDLTLTDLVADARAATPSQAAELLVPDRSANVRVLREVGLRLERAMRSRLSEDELVLERLRRSLGDPRAWLGERRQKVDDLEGRAREAVLRATSARRRQSLRLSARLGGLHPKVGLAEAAGALGALELRLRAAARRRLDGAKAELGEAAGRLHELSPLAVLARGYSVALRPDGRALGDASDVAPGERLTLRLHRGALSVRVEGHAAPEPPS
jgi:exodeoxyribonuclease VII large subunit